MTQKESPPREFNPPSQSDHVRNHLPVKTRWPLSRRQFLWRLSLAVLPPSAACRVAGAAQINDTGVQSFDFSSLQTPLTRTNAFFIRNHFKTQLLSIENWKLRVTGAVRNPLELGYREIVSQPGRNLTVTLECAGNQVGGGGVSTATWTGIGLRELLDRASLQPGVKFIRLVGADQGSVDDSFGPPVSFMRSIPLGKALSPDTLLAHQMNGASLPAEHGYPLRAIVPGWYGMDSVKGLARIEALEHDDRGYFMTERYVTTRLLAVGSLRTPVTRMRVKSQIARPHEGEVLPPGPYEIRGAAWAGESKIGRVEVSVDAGKSWALAALESTPQRYAWVLWNQQWVPQGPGVYAITVRAIDDEGTTQPWSQDPLQIDGYEDNWYHAVHCEVR